VNADLFPGCSLPTLCIPESGLAVIEEDPIGLTPAGCRPRALRALVAGDEVERYRWAEVLK
jgi:hypothetical protein